MAISNRLRFEIFRRDGFRCTYCGLTAQEVALTVDHVTPRALGGMDHPSNLTTACEPCNSGKSSTLVNSPLLAAAPEPSQAEQEDGDPTHDAILAVWVNECREGVTDEQGRAFEASLRRARETDTEEVHRLAEAALYAAWVGGTDIQAALKDMDRSQILTAWSSCWLSAAGEFPDDDAYARVAAQIDALLAQNNWILSRVHFAAVRAGANRSTRLHFMLSQDELAATGEDGGFDRMLDAWSASFRDAAGRWPSKEEGEPLWQKFKDLPLHACTWDDLRSAATAAGAYQSADLRPCLAPFGDIFAAAALLPDPAAASTT